MPPVTVLTPNKLYPLQPVGSNVGRWGTVLNSDLISVLDKNLGSPFEPVLSGNANYVVSDEDAENIRHNLTGTLTGDIDYILPARGGFYIISNNTAGGHAVTVLPAGGSGVMLSAAPSFIFINTDTNAAEIVVGGAPTFPIALVNGGTGAGTAAGARDNLAVAYSDQIDANGSGQLVLVPDEATAALNPFVGDSGTGGLQGLVPAPSAGDAAAKKFLSASGDFEAIDAGDISGIPSLSGDNTWTGYNAFAGIGTTIRAVTANDSVNSDDHTIECNATSGNITITLPPIANSLGRELTVKKTDSSAHTVSVSGDANIDNAASYLISLQGQTLSLQGGETNWAWIS
jgi:hypothetical protein